MRARWPLIPTVGEQDAAYVPEDGLDGGRQGELTALRKVCAGGGGLPLGDFLLPLIELGAETLESNGAEDEMERRIGRFDDSHHGVNCAQWIAGLLADLVVEIFACFAGSGVVFGDAVCGFYAGATKEVGAKGTGLDEGDVDAERGELLRESFREAFDGELGGVVVAPAGGADETGDGGDVEDVTAALLAEMRQQSLGNADEAEDVGVEHRHELVFGDFFDCSGEAVAGVVDEDVDGTVGGRWLCATTETICAGSR